MKAINRQCIPMGIPVPFFTNIAIPFQFLFREKKRSIQNKWKTLLDIILSYLVLYSRHNNKSSYNYYHDKIGPQAQ